VVWVRGGSLLFITNWEFWVGFGNHFTRGFLSQSFVGGGAPLIVVQDREQYVKGGLSHVANETVYKPLTEDITPWIKAEILSKLESRYRTGMIDEEMHEFCVPPKEHRTSQLKKFTKTQWASGPWFQAAAA